MLRRRTPSIAYTHVLGPWAAASLVATLVLGLGTYPLAIKILGMAQTTFIPIVIETIGLPNSIYPIACKDEFFTSQETRAMKPSSGWSTPKITVASRPGCPSPVSA